MEKADLLRQKISSMTFGAFMLVVEEAIKKAQQSDDQNVRGMAVIFQEAVKRLKLAVSAASQEDMAELSRRARAIRTELEGLQ